MKTLLRSVFVNGLALWWAAILIPGLLVKGELKTLLLAAVALMVLNKTVIPLIKLFLLPINLITLGLLGWVANVVTLFIITRLVPGVGIVGFSFTGFELNGFIVPSITFSVFAVYILASLGISVINSVIRWLFAK